MRYPRMELAVTLAFTVLILVGLYLTSRIDLAFSSDLETFSGPRAYPGLILSVLLVLNLFTVAGLARRFFRQTASSPDQTPTPSGNIGQSAGLFAALVIFVLTFEQVGYILTMVPLLTIAALLCGAKSPIKAFLVSFILATICLVIFRYGLATVLPDGFFGIDMFL